MLAVPATPPRRKVDGYNIGLRGVLNLQKIAKKALSTVCVPQELSRERTSNVFAIG